MGIKPKQLHRLHLPSSLLFFRCLCQRLHPRVLPQVYLELGACPHCTACLNRESQHVAPPLCIPTVTRTHHLARFSQQYDTPAQQHSGGRQSAQMCNQNIPRAVHICQHSQIPSQYPRVCLCRYAFLLHNVMRRVG